MDSTTGRKEQQVTTACPLCGGTEFSQDTDDFDRGEWGLFRCDSCMASLREESRVFADGSSETTGRMVLA